MRRRQHSHHTVAFRKALEPCKQVFLQIALNLFRYQPKKKLKIGSGNTYFESCESKVTDFHLEILVNQNILALNITMNNAESMHIVVHLSCLETNFQSFLYRQLYLFLHVKHLKQRALIDMLKYYYDIWNRRDDTHKQSDIRVSQDTLHDNLVLYFLEQLIGDVRIKNFLYGHRRSIECTFVDYRETTLSNLFTKFYILFCDFSNSRNWWESTRCN